MKNSNMRNIKTKLMTQTNDSMIKPVALLPLASDLFSTLVTKGMGSYNKLHTPHLPPPFSPIPPLYPKVSWILITVFTYDKQAFGNICYLFNFSCLFALLLPLIVRWGAAKNREKIPIPSFKS